MPLFPPHHCGRGPQTLRRLDCCVCLRSRWVPPPVPPQRLRRPSASHSERRRRCFWFALLCVHVLGSHPVLRCPQRQSSPSPVVLVSTSPSRANSRDTLPAAPCSTGIGWSGWCLRCHPSGRRFDARAARSSPTRSGRTIVMQAVSGAAVLRRVLLYGADICARPSRLASGRLVCYDQAQQTFNPVESGRGVALGGPSRRLRGGTSLWLRLTAALSATLHHEQAACCAHGRF